MADVSSGAKGKVYDNIWEVVEVMADIEDTEKSMEACGIGDSTYEKVIYERKMGGNVDTSITKASKQITPKQPNYFLCLKLQDEDTIKALVDVQRLVVGLYPSYRDHAMNNNGWHLTLRVLILRSDDEIRTCDKAMDNISNEVRKYMQKIESLAFKGLGQFGSSIVFAKVQCTAALMDLVEFIYGKLSDAGVSVVSHDFKPHVTLFRIPRWAGSKVEIDSQDLARFADMDFGRQPIDNILLCQMGTLKVTATSGFYTTAASILLKE